MRYRIRAPIAEDVEALLDLAEHLDTVNLPCDKDVLAQLIERSTASYAGALPDARRAEYVFVLEDLERSRLLGTSMIIAQLGRKDAPYVYFECHREEYYSRTLDRHRSHQVLRMRYCYDGPTELGGLVVHPHARGRAERLGRMISWVRFVWIALHRQRVQSELLAELLPPLAAGRQSPWWDAVGLPFTGLSYHYANRLSKNNKDFIRALFPRGDIYVSLLTEPARAVLGRVGESSRGAKKLLEDAGFRMTQRVDPFDGGPHFLARTDAVVPIRQSLLTTLRVGDRDQGEPHLVLRALPHPPWLCAGVALLQAAEDGQSHLLSPADAPHFELHTDTPAAALPWPARSPWGVSELR